MKKFLFIFLLSVMVFLQCSTLRAGNNESKALRESILADGYTRTYALYRPTGWDKLKGMPLVMLLHGAGGDAEGMEQLTGFIAIAEREKFVLAYPEGMNNRWNDGRGRNENINDVEFIRTLIGFLKREYNIDSDKVYVAGMSNGGFMTMRLACELSDKIAAVAAVAATVDSAVDADCQTGKPMPVMLIIGDKDKLVPVNGGVVSRLPKSTLLSHRSIVEKWARRDGCNMRPAVTNLPELKHDNTTVTETRYTGGRNGSEVISYVIGNGGHTWPGGYQYLSPILVGKTTHELNASEVIWEFFKRH